MEPIDSLEARPSAVIVLGDHRDAARRIELEREPGNSCRHLRILVGEARRSVECRDCGAMLDPIETLLRFAHEESRLLWERERATSLWALLKERSRVLCPRCRKMVEVRP